MNATESPFNQTTSNIGQALTPTIQAIYNGLNKHYYSMVVDYKKNESDQNMLLNLYRRKWTEQLRFEALKQQKEKRDSALDRLKALTANYPEYIAR